MKLMMVFGSALLLTASSLAQAGEPQEPVNPSPESAAPTESPAAAPVPPPAPAPAAAPVAPALPEPVLAPDPGPEPYTGWGRGVRAPIYVNMMFSAGIFTEDGDNRFTTRDSKNLEGFGGVFRVGAVLDEHHRIGARMQSFMRPTKKLLLDPPAASNTNNEWGVVTLGYIGPEYLYTTDFGLYAGGSLGVAGAMSRTNFDDDDDDDDRHIERGSAGVAGIASLGYEWRANKWFAMNAEVYGGLYHGIDDNENSMNDALFGLGVGLGF